MSTDDEIVSKYSSLGLKRDQLSRYGKSWHLREGYRMTDEERKLTLDGMYGPEAPTSVRVVSVYVAAMWGSKEVARRLAGYLIAVGFTVTSRWLDIEAANLDAAAAHAQMDLEDIDRADALVLMTLPVGTTYTGGGRHVEFGYALAKSKRVLVLGEREQIFCHLPEVTVCSTVDELIRAIR